LTTIELLQKSNKDSVLRKIPSEQIDSKKVYDAAIAGDELAKEIFEYTGRILGLALANAVMFSSPEAIILFGGLTKAGELILKPTREHMEANLIKVFQNKVKILVSHLKEADAAILGASALAWELK
jgi:glucokinase